MGSESSAAVKAIPYLTIAGAAEAIEFYGQAFGAVESHRMTCPETGLLMHAAITIGGAPIYMSDEFPSMGSKSPKALGGTPVTIHLTLPDVDTTFAQAVAAGATPVMPPMDMFWGDRFGKIIDPFGHAWSLATTKEVLSAEQMEDRMKAAIAAQKGECATADAV